MWLWLLWFCGVPRRACATGGRLGWPVRVAGGRSLRSRHVLSVRRVHWAVLVIARAEVLPDLRRCRFLDAGLRGGTDCLDDGALGVDEWDGFALLGALNRGFDDLLTDSRDVR